MSVSCPLKIVTSQAKMRQETYTRYRLRSKEQFRKYLEIEKTLFKKEWRWILVGALMQCKLFCLTLSVSGVIRCRFPQYWNKCRLQHTEPAVSGTEISFVRFGLWIDASIKRCERCNFRSSGFRWDFPPDFGFARDNSIVLSKPVSTTIFDTHSETRSGRIKHCSSLSYHVVLVHGFARLGTSLWTKVQWYLSRFVTWIIATCELRYSEWRV